MQTIVNLGTGGADLNGQNGSTTSADSNDALFLDWPGDNAGNYVYLPGVSGNYLSVPDEAALDITGDIDIRVQVALDDWTPSGDGSFITKYVATGNQRSWQFYLDTPSDTLRFVWSTDGTSGTLVGVSSTATPVVSDGDALWVRVTVDVDNGASGHDVKFYTSGDGSSWSQLGATVTTAGTTSIFASTAPVFIGATSYVAAKFYRAEVWDGIEGSGGTKVLDVDTSVISSGSATSFTAVTGQTVTINRSTSGRKSVAVVSPVWSFAADDYWEVADNALLDIDAADSLTLVAVIRVWSTPGTDTVAGKKASTSTADAGYLLTMDATSGNARVRASDGTNAISSNSTTPTFGAVSTYVLQRDVSADVFAATIAPAALSTTTDTTTATLANASSFFVGSIGGSLAGEYEVLGVAVFRRALAETELAAINTYYQNKAA